MLEVIDLVGLPLDAPERKTAYPRDTFELGVPMRYLHLMSTRWYFDASDPRNEAEANRVKSELCFAAETWKVRDGYRPIRVVVDNFGGTIVGERVS